MCPLGRSVLFCVAPESHYMNYEINHLGQPVDRRLIEWKPPQRPQREVMVGRWCRVVPLDPQRHAETLFAQFAADKDGRMWTYLPYGPFDSVSAFRDWMDSFCMGDDPLFFAIESTDGQPLGIASYLRIDPKAGSIEVGHLLYSANLKRSVIATEAMWLMMAAAFALGYRRYEWKCDALNAPSRAAAARLGFTFEGVFRQAIVVKGRNRDTAWYAIIDRDWPVIQKAMNSWLDPGNFDDQGLQRMRLSDLTAAIRQSER